MSTVSLLFVMNSLKIPQMSLDELLAAFESSVGSLGEEGERESVNWPAVMRISHYGCSVSQRIHLLICQERRRAEMPCESAAAIFGSFVETAKRILTREAPPAGFHQFQTCVQNVEDRQTDLSELAADTSEGDQLLGFDTRERPRTRSRQS